MRRSSCGHDTTPHLITCQALACKSSSHQLLSRAEALSPCGHSRSSIKAGPAPSSLTHSFQRLLLCDQQGTLHNTDMSCYNLCNPCGPTPLANSCNEPCVRQCEDSHVAIQPSTVVVTLPGPILSSFPQNTAVGSSASAAVGSNLSAQGVPVSGGGFGGFGLGGLGGYGLGGLGCFSGRRACYPC
ncbi:feather beta keratin-like [Anas platyrhynchos]|uniref:feather beta keratin-like n=1 Tax=Anas platyrhynchos TaxID=8839 RepID=UPI003AF247B3